MPSKARRQAPIGVFDSGLGGLTVARAIRQRLPEEDLVYLGDSARVPYGTRSARTVLSYARGCARRLYAHDIKLLVVACNTVSAVALETLVNELDIPVLGVIEPGARAGVAHSRNGRIGVLATATTIDSGAYPRAVSALDPQVETKMAAAPLLVPLAEEGWTSGEVPQLVVRRYLAPLLQERIDTLVLGCTHYPLLRDVITAELALQAGSPLPVVDSAEATASDLAAMLEARELLATRPRGGDLQLLVTDRPRSFTEIAARFLGQAIEGLAVESIDL